MSAIIARASVADMVKLRNQSLEKFSEAHGILCNGGAALEEARKLAKAAAPSHQHYTYASDIAHKEFLGGLQVPVREDFLEAARKMVDRNIWARIIELTDLERLMDKEAKDQLRKEMTDNPVEVTEENVYATVETFAHQADNIFRRGVANVFSKLDRRFRSHDGFKIGSRIVINYVFDENGYWHYRQGHRDTLMDIDRAFRVLDGKPEAQTYAGIVGEIETARGRSWGARQTYLESDYFRIRAWKNGNVHIYFRRDDLLEKVNKLLGEYYGEVLGDSQTTEEDVLNKPKTSVAMNFGFYPTPPPTVERVIEEANIFQRGDDPPLLVLEPSAGQGALAAACRAKGGQVDCVEIQAELVQSLLHQGFSVYHRDFLDVAPNPIYDRVVMNPPFDRERDIDHIMHATKFLKPDGRLVSVMSAGTEFRQTKKAIAFREFVKSKRGDFIDLPSGSFSSVGTNINTIICVINMNGAPAYRWR